MSRIIKFRAWDEDSKTMLNPVDLSAPISTYDWLGKKDVILMQYTGLSDVDGNEIYEGDIIKYLDEYIDGSFGTEVMIEEVEYDDCGFMPLADKGYSGDNIEVIGNIYENPELLNQ